MALKSRLPKAMDTTALEGLLAELAQERPATLAVIEGLRDNLRLNLKPPTASGVEALLFDYERRDGLIMALDNELATALATARTLLADGYPVLPSRDFDKPEMDDLLDNRMTQEAALAQCRLGEFTTEGAIEVGPEAPIDA